MKYRFNPDLSRVEVRRPDGTWMLSAQDQTTLKVWQHPDFRPLLRSFSAAVGDEGLEEALRQKFEPTFPEAA